MMQALLEKCFYGNPRLTSSNSIQMLLTTEAFFFSFVNVEQASAMFKEPRKILFVLMFYSSVQNSWGNIVCLERIVYVDISSPLCCTT
jgi:hypothetical protein